MAKRDPIRALLEQVQGLKTGLYQKDFLLTWAQSLDELRAVLLIAEALEAMWAANISARVFDGGLAVSNFRDKSTRTRFSFASAASLLGLTPTDLDEGKSQIAHGETVRETANMISFLTEVIGIRDDMFLGAGHEYMVEVSDAVEQGYRAGVLPQRPGVINLQCDRDHPTQAMADLLHLQKTFGSLEALRGKRIAMTWAYSPSYGKPLSVPQGIIGLMTRFGMDVVLAHPEGYDLIPETIEIARRHAAESGGKFSQVTSLDDAFRNADIVYPKSWAPFQVMQERTTLLRGGQAHALDELEKRCLANNAKHRDWECTEKLMALTRGGKALYMHCLPADITDVSCKEGEVAASVFDRYRDATYNEASHKPFVIAAMMLLTRFADPAGALRGLVSAARPRRLVGNAKKRAKATPSQVRTPATSRATRRGK
jgi:knotted carbamoyltransferase YgeW